MGKQPEVIAMEVEVDEADAKAQRKAAKKAAKAAAAAEVEAEPEVDEAKAKAQRKAAKKAAKEAAAAAEAAAEKEVDEAEAKRQRKAAKKAAKEAAAAAAEEEEEPATPKKAKKEKRADEAEEEDEEVPKAKKAKVEVAEEPEAKKVFKVFMKGLPFSADEATLRKDFSVCGEIASMQCPHNEEGKPKGFAFIVYATQEGFDAALKYDNTEYGGRYINVQEAGEAGAKGKGKGKDGKGKDGKDKSKGKDGDWTCPSCSDLVFARNAACRKCGTAKPGGGGSCSEHDQENQVFIRGLPWSITEDNLKKDFAECGEIVASKFPMNDEGRPRGIAFLKFSTTEGFEAALKFDNTDYGGRMINVCKSGEGKGEGPAKGKGKGKDGKDGKGKDKGKGKGKKGKAPTEAFAKSSGCIVASTAEVKKFDDSDDE